MVMSRSASTLAASALVSTVALAQEAIGPPAEVIQACTTAEQWDVVEPWMLSSTKPSPPRKGVVDVTTLGAKPDDEIDDTAALEAAPAGHTIHFPEGTYLVSRPLRLKSATTYSGAGTLKRAAPGAGFIMIAKTVTDVAVTGLTFRGGGIIIGGAKDIRIERNRFLDIVDPQARFGHEAGIFVDSTLTDSAITANHFSRIGFLNGQRTTEHSAAIQAYHLQNVAIEHNKFTNVHQGISVIFEGRARTGAGLKVAGNVVINPLRMGIELWGKGMTGAVVEENCVRAARVGDEDVGLSIVADGEGSTIGKNLVIQVQPPSAECAGMAIEVAGRNASVSGNFVAGHWCAAIATYNERSWSAAITGNRVCGHRSEHLPIDFIGGIGSSTSLGNEIQRDCPDSIIVPLDPRASSAVR